MTHVSLEGLQFDPPADFVHEEVVSSWRVPLKNEVKDPKLLQAQAVVRPNLTVTRVQVDEPDLEAITARACHELMERIQGVQGVRATQIVFADGKNGMLVEYAFPVMSFTVVQMQALRVDDHTLTTLALCTEASRMTNEVRDEYVKSLQSAKVKA